MTDRVPTSSLKPGTADADQAPAVRTTNAVLSVSDGTASAALALEQLRNAAKDLGWTDEALAIHLKNDREYRGYVNRVLNGVKPLTLTFLEGLPGDLLARFYAQRAEQFGCIVVAPPDDYETARRQLVGALLTLVAPSLPLKAGAPLKVSIGDRHAEPRRAAR